MSFLDFLREQLLLGWLLDDDERDENKDKASAPPVHRLDSDAEDRCYDRMHSLESRIEELERQQDRCDAFSDRYDDLQDMIDELQDEIDELQDKLDDLDDSLDEL